ncbi:hypothetical protein [Nostoc sp. MS1]|uniref:hypothetical protein n=1 Tax=Nostoc sp. MS1 TaxID=2764711 RepID=UPI001CC47275|nr:hypothetical protein [Nostoc sp. MS1]BCL38897.1 hypothetical protein NSMS1_53440 [Nostoc sp. MS1]
MSKSKNARLSSYGQLFDLNTLIATDLGVTLNYASGINNHGQIIVGTYSNTQASPRRAFLLTPIVSVTTPEPSFVVGLLAFFAFTGCLTSKRVKKSFNL